MLEVAVPFAVRVTVKELSAAHVSPAGMVLLDSDTVPAKF